MAGCFTHSRSHRVMHNKEVHINTSLLVTHLIFEEDLVRCDEHVEFQPFCLSMDPLIFTDLRGEMTKLSKDRSTVDCLPSEPSFSPNQKSPTFASLKKVFHFL